MVTILRPDLLDYEGQREFSITVEAHDLVTPETARRYVRVARMEGGGVLEET